MCNYTRDNNQVKLFFHEKNKIAFIMVNVECDYARFNGTLIVNYGIACINKKHASLFIRQIIIIIY